MRSRTCAPGPASSPLSRKPALAFLPAGVVRRRCCDKLRSWQPFCVHRVNDLTCSNNINNGTLSPRIYVGVSQRVSDRLGVRPRGMLAQRRCDPTLRLNLIFSCVCTSSISCMSQTAIFPPDLNRYLLPSAVCCLLQEKGYEQNSASHTFIICYRCLKTQ